MVNGGTYALTAPIFGYLTDRFRASHVPINFLGIAATTLAFLFLGPAPFLGLPTLISVCVAALVLHGMGNGAVLVSSFVIAHKEAINSGFSNNVNTYGLVSGMWASTFALGAFVGPSAAGVLQDHVGFEWGAMYVVILGSLFLVIGGAMRCCKRPSFMRKVTFLEQRYCRHLRNQLLKYAREGWVFLKCTLCVQCLSGGTVYEKIDESGATDPLLETGNRDHHSFARRQRRSPSAGYESGSNSPGSAGSEEQNRNEQVCGRAGAGHRFCDLGWVGFSLDVSPHLAGPAEQPSYFRSLTHSVSRSSSGSTLQSSSSRRPAPRARAAATCRRCRQRAPPRRAPARSASTVACWATLCPGFSTAATAQARTTATQQNSKIITRRRRRAAGK